MNGYSLEVQEEKFHTYCNLQGWQSANIYREEGESGRTIDRPQFKAMMADAETGAFDVLCVHRLDRLSRRLRDILEIFHNLSDLGIALVSIEEQFDFSTPHGRLVMQVLGALAEWQAARLAEEVAKGIEGRARHGLPWGIPPLGYCYGRCSICEDERCPEKGNEDKRDGVPIPHPVDSRAIIFCFEEYAKGRDTYESLAHKIRGMGYTINGRPWTRDTVAKVFKKRFYCGEIEHLREILPGQHEPLVSDRLWERCREIRSQHSFAPRSHSTKTRTYLFARLIRCEACGQPMTADCKRSGNHHNHYYRCVSRKKVIRCPASQRRVREDRLESQARAIMERIKLPEDWRERVLEIAGSQEEQARLERERTRLEEKLKRLKTMFVDVEITDAEYRRQRGNVEAKLREMAFPEGEDLSELASFLESLGAAWQVATKEEKRSLALAVFDGLYCDTDTQRLVAFEPKRAFVPLLREIGILREDNARFHLAQSE